MKSQKDKDFVEYVMSFYGPEGLYVEFFGSGVSEEEVKMALKIRKKNKKFAFEGDSIDREIVRDIMLYQRGERNGLESNMKPYFKDSENEQDCYVRYDNERGVHNVTVRFVSNLVYEKMNRISKSEEELSSTKDFLSRQGFKKKRNNWGHSLCYEFKLKGGLIRIFLDTDDEGYQSFDINVFNNKDSSVCKHLAHDSFHEGISELKKYLNKCSSEEGNFWDSFSGKVVSLVA